MPNRLRPQIDRLPPGLLRLGERVHWPLSDRNTLLAGVVALLIAFLLYRNCGVGGCPDVRQLAAWQPNGAPELLDRNGEKFASLAPFERHVVPLDSLGDHVAQAFIAVEDRRFWEHDGVDWRRVFGAALVNLRTRGVAQGSSTISMQLARNVFPRELPGTERTLRRKLREARVAHLIERRFSKHEILEMYLNHIYFGGGAYGIEAASRHWFGKSAKQLRLSEAAMLAALPKAPRHYDPRRQPERARARRNLVLTLMEEQGFVKPETAEESRQTRLRPVADPPRRSGIPLGAYYIDVVRRLLEDRFGEDLYRSRLRIHTTLDPLMQQGAERELEKQLAAIAGRVRKGSGPLQGAVVVMEAHTGEVLALVGGRDPATSRYNRALNARRQVGSAFKPFVFATALEEGVPTSQHIADTPLRMQLSRNDVWEPENYDGRFEGEVSLRDALVRSRNVPTVRLASSVGIDDVATTARNAGIGAQMDVTPALSLGTVAMSPLQLATAYTTFATLGTTAAPSFLRRVEDENGRVLWEPQAQPRRPGMRADVAYIITDILRDAVDYGTGTSVRAAGYRGPVAGKTGTTNNATDAWFVGYTPELVGTIWIGYDEPSALGSAATGGGLAAPVWGRMMRAVERERGAGGEWRMPSGVRLRTIDPNSGLLLAEGCQPEWGSPANELFIAGNEPATACPYRDWWSDLWGRIGGVLGGGRTEPRNGDVLGADPLPGRRDREADIEDFRRRRREQLERDRLERSGQEEADRSRQMEEFLRQRSEALRERANRRRPRGDD
ncbi:MAG TPA: PBP1A family penicillin-binding protein [Longimicrobiales bacterium]|nr:PBP1A family penicillin-binding protein [Longimicrobiales bacterium]